MMADDQDPEFKSAMAAAVRILTGRDHTCHELRTKLVRKGVRRDTAEEVIAACRRLNYLDDRRLARFYVDELQRKGYGARFIQKSMRTKGFSTESTQAAQVHLEDEDAELDAAKRALGKKQRTFEREKDPRKRREKIYRYLYSRGFSSSVISVLTRR